MGILGRIQGALGWATGDRRVEAEGRLHQLDDAPHSGGDAPGGDALLDEAELHVRADHGDLAPDAEPDDRPPQSPRTDG